MKIRKIASFILVVSIMCGCTSTAIAQGIQNLDANAEKQDYLIVAKDDNATENLVDNNVINCEQLENTNILSAEMTDNQYDYIKENENVYKIEKDIVLSGSSEDENLDTDVINNIFKKVNTEDLNQWNLDAVNSVDEHFSDKVKVELLDSGVSASSDMEVKKHINLIPDEDGINPLFEDYSGHGTSMAGAICAKDNNIGVTGINPDVDLYSVKVLDNNVQAPLSRIIDGIYWGIENNMDIINMSFGTSINSAILHEAIKLANEAGILLIASSGNDSTKEVQYPANYSEVLSVGSIDENGEISNFTSLGENLDVVAPGEKIESAGSFGTVISTQGTSVACAQVTGIASKLLQKDSTVSPNFIKKLIKASAKQIEKNSYETGIVDCDYALTIYDEVKKSYVEHQSIIEYNNPNEVESFDTTGFVNGLWFTVDNKTNRSHSNMAEDAYNGNNATVLQLIKGGAIAADKTVDGYVFKDILALHGNGNYVANLRIAWEFVNEFARKNVEYNGKTGATYDNDAIQGAYNYALAKAQAMPCYYNSAGDISGSGSITLAMLDCFKNIGSVDFTKLNTLNVTIDRMNRTYNFCKVVGLVAHLVGDIFAHRTMVPVVYSTEAYDDKFYDMKLDSGKRIFNNNGTSDLFTNLEDIASTYKGANFNNTHEEYRDVIVLRDVVSRGAVEFRDIKYYSDLYYNNNATVLCKNFEDNTYFYSRRYDDCCDICERLFDLGWQGAFTLSVLVPPLNSNNTSVKLEDFKTFATTSGVDVSSYDNSDWIKNTGIPKIFKDGVIKNKYELSNNS